MDDGGWMNGCTDGRKNGWLVGWMDDEWIDGWMDVRTGGWMNG
jgi:hypothetical protein